LRARPGYEKQRIYNKAIHGLLRLFPDKPARHLQHLGVSQCYMDYGYRIFRSSNARRCICLQGRVSEDEGLLGTF
jgi:hypothetical protein